MIALLSGLSLFASPALARPTENGMFRFDSTDVVTYLDSADGTARVWYSTEGPNVVKAGDADADGLPDFAELVAVYTADVLTTYEDFGFRPIPNDAGAGGSDAMDVYLVDFAGNSDGNYSPERCTDNVCTGFFVMENDFQGYGYSNVDSAVSTLTSHELFHAQQAAYNNGQDAWYAEGTAVWAEQLYDPESEDFRYFCEAYLDDTGRSLNIPPSGVLPPFVYGTALWWKFLTLRYGDAWMIDYLEATGDGEDLLLALDARTTLSTDFVDFSVWNLATGGLSGGLAGDPGLEGYSFASDIGPPKFEERDPSLDDDNRFYPLAATYYKLEWEGGPLQFAIDADAPDVVFQLWATNADGAVSELVAEPESVAGLVELGDFDAGDYYFIGVNPTLAEDSTKVRFCLGADASACAPEATGDSADTGGSGQDKEHGGCGCASAPESDTAGAAIGLAMGVVAATRRRRRAVERA
jgi:MYXO-CTERM domain-containing protein